MYSTLHPLTPTNKAVTLIKIGIEEIADTQGAHHKEGIEAVGNLVTVCGCGPRFYGINFE